MNWDLVEQMVDLLAFVGVAVLGIVWLLTPDKEVQGALMLILGVVISISRDVRKIRGRQK